MLDDIRNHDPLPTAEEQEWMALHELGAIARAVLLATVALAIGWAASVALEDTLGDQVATVQQG